MYNYRIRETCFSNRTYKNGEGNGTPLQCSCLENPMDGGAWWAAVEGVALESLQGQRDLL